MRVNITNSNFENKKMKAVFYDFNNKKIRTVHFGLVLGNDFLRTKNEEEKKRHIERYEKYVKNEKMEDPMAGITLSRYILWNKPTKTESIKDYKMKFDFL
jgi:hypothetical protein